MLGRLAKAAKAQKKLDRAQQKARLLVEMPSCQLTCSKHRTCASCANNSVDFVRKAWLIEWNEGNGQGELQAIAKAKQMVSSSEEPRRAAKKKEKVQQGRWVLVFNGFSTLDGGNQTSSNLTWNFDVGTSVSSLPITTTKVFLSG